MSSCHQGYAPSDQEPELADHWQFEMRDGFSQLLWSLVIGITDLIKIIWKTTISVLLRRKFFIFMIYLFIKTCIKLGWGAIESFFSFEFWSLNCYKKGKDTLFVTCSKNSDVILWLPWSAQESHGEHIACFGLS